MSHLEMQGCKRKPRTEVASKPAEIYTLRGAWQGWRCPRGEVRGPQSVLDQKEGTAEHGSADLAPPGPGSFRNVQETPQ